MADFPVCPSSERTGSLLPCFAGVPSKQEDPTAKLFPRTVSPIHFQSRKIVPHNPSVASRQLPLHKGALAAYRADNAFFYQGDCHASVRCFVAMTGNSIARQIPLYQYDNLHRDLQSSQSTCPLDTLPTKNRLTEGTLPAGDIYRTYSMTTQRLGSTPVEWVVMLSISCRAAWITWRS